MSEELEKGIPNPIVTGRVEFTQEEKTQNKKEFIKILKRLGFFEDDEFIED